jgi:transcriptional regulator of acetoin/glycerol metabolism
VAVDLGIVAASHRELRAAVAKRRFRDDLYYRLARAVVTLPSLRQRRSDIPRLVVRALQAADRRLVAHPRLIETCCIRPWPGNVRELLQAVATAAVAARAAEREVVRPEDLPAAAGTRIEEEVTARVDTAPAAVPITPAPPPEIDRATVAAALAAAGGNISAAARQLGLHRTQLRRLMQRFGLAPST